MHWMTPVLSDEDEVHRRLKRARAHTDRRSKPDLWKELDQAISALESKGVGQVDVGRSADLDEVSERILNSQAGDA
jgi:hypothetical protein